MTGLTGVELRRLAARKILWVTLVGALVIVIVTLATVFLQARDLDMARAGMNEQYDQVVADHERYLQECQQEEAKERRRTGDPAVDFGCTDMQPPTIEEMFGSMPSLAEQYRFLLQGLVYPFAFLALVMGSTAVAAEFSHRTMGSWLTFAPRRTPVFLSKILAPSLAAVPLTIAGIGLVLVGVPAIFRWFRLDDGVGGQEWVDLGWMALRLVVVAMLAGALGAGAAFLVRHSGVVVGVVVGYLVLVEGMVGSALGGVQRYLLGRNISAFVQDGTEWETWTNCSNFDGCEPVRHSLSLEHGATVLVVLLGVVLLLAWARFRTADID
jgi:ABC-2 type transport system permease protein